MNSLHIAINMLKRTLFQKKGLLMYIIVPTLVVSLIIGFLSQEPTRIVKVGYINKDQGALGKHLVNEISNLGDYQLKEAVDEQELKEWVIMNKVNAGFQIPVDFTESLYAVKRPQVDQFLLSMSEATYTLQINLDSIVSRLTKTISTLQATGLQGDSLPTAVEKVIQQSEKHQVKAQVTDLGLYINPSLNTIIGFMLMFMMGLINNTVNHIMADRRQRTMARIYTAPVRAFEIMLGNFLGSFCVGTLQVLFILVFTRYVMGFDYHLPFLSHFIVLEFFLLACIGIASAVAGLIKNSRNISTINTLIITPTCMLGGCFWPVYVMPEWMQKIANFVPQTWVIDAIERMSSGSSLGDVMLHVGILSLFALILLGVGSVILKPGEAEAG